MAVEEIIPKSQRTENIKGILRWAALFLGELRDGLTMINMQSAFLIVAKGYTEKQVGVLFFVFGMSQFLCQTPAGYLYDYTEQKVLWLSTAGILTTLLTLVTATFASQDNFGLMVFIKLLQGGITSFIPPGLNSITQGIVGAVGMTKQVSVNEMMNHLGTSILVLSGSVIAYFKYPDIGVLFIVSPIFCIIFLYFINQIGTKDIDHDAARGLTSEASGSGKTASLLSSGSKEGMPAKSAIKEGPSFNFGFGRAESSSVSAAAAAAPDAGAPKANTPLQVLRDPILLTFLGIVFLFHLSNGTVLPLVMQTLAIGNGPSGILMSGLCITIAQVIMVASAKICGDWSGKYGRKWLFLVGLISVPVRCAILGGLLQLRYIGEDGEPKMAHWLQMITLSTQILDGVGAGVFGTMYILVTSDISGGTGRFGLTLGMTTAAMSIGGTVSGYLGQALAQDRGYQAAFFILMVLSLIPAVLYFVLMPETLPDHARHGDAGNGTNIASIKEATDEEEATSTRPSVRANTAPFQTNTGAGETGYVEMT